VLHTLNKEFEDSKTLRTSKLSSVSAWIFLVLDKRLNNIWLKHNKLKLEIVSFIRKPFSFGFLFYCDEVFDFVFNKVVLGVLALRWCCTLFLMTYVTRS